MREETRRELSKRLRFIEGQARGIERMLIEGRTESELVTQLLAVQAAAGAAAELALRERMAQDIKARLAMTVLNCVGPCDLCESLADVTRAIEGMDFSDLIGSARKSH